MRIRLVPIILLAIIGLPSIAQSNARVDALLLQAEAKTDLATYMVLVAGHQIGEKATPAEALAFAKGKRWLPAKSDAQAPIKLNAFCALAMRAIGASGGIFYTLFPGPRYAYKELSAKGIVNSSGGPTRTMPGDEVLRVLQAVIDLKGGGR